MMRKLFFSLFFVSSFAFSAPADVKKYQVPPASFSLDSVSVSQVLRLVFSEVLKGSYVLDPVVVSDQRQVTFRWSSEKGDVRPFLISFLDSLGYRLVVRNNVDYVYKKEEAKDIVAENDVFIYRPKFRSGSYLVDLLSPLFSGSFTSQRGIKIPGDSKSPMSSVPPGSVASMMERDTDTIIFSGSSAEIAKLEKILPQIDFSTSQILVRAALYEVQTSKSDSSAFQLAASILSGKFGISIGSATNVLSNSVSLKTTGSFSIDAVLSALSTDSRFKVVSSPSMRVRDGATAKLVVGQDVPVLGALSYPQGAGQAVQSVEYRSSGVIFELTPKIKDSNIELAVMQQVSNFVNTTTGVDSSPTLTKREFSTSVNVVDGDLIVLGGLDENKESKAESGLPFLPAFLRSESAGTSKSETLLILQITKV